MPLLLLFFIRSHDIASPKNFVYSHFIFRRAKIAEQKFCGVMEAWQLVHFAL